MVLFLIYKAEMLPAPFYEGTTKSKEAIATHGKLMLPHHKH